MRRLTRLVAVLAAFSDVAVAQELKQTLLRLDPVTGDYVIDYKSGAESRRFVFTPATRITPRVRSSVGRAVTSESFDYEYEISNHESSRQPLYSFSMPADSATVMKPGPEGWRAGFTGLVNRAGWYKLTSPGEQRSGIPPGGSQRGFGFTSPSLPGPATASFRGPTGAPVIPNDFPDDLRGELYEALRELLGRDTVDVPVISAVIPGASTTPGLKLSAFLKNVEQRYVISLGQSSHPGGLQLLSGLRDAIEHASAGREAEARRAVSLTLTVPGGDLDAWAEDLDKAFRFCLRYSAELPVGEPF